MAQLAKFHEKAIAIYGVAQVAEGISAVQTTPAGAISTTVGSAAVVGVGTVFTTYACVGSYIFTAGATPSIIGRIKTVTDDLNIVLEDVVPAAAVVLVQGSVMAIATAVSSVAFQTGLGPKNAIAVLNLNYTTELSSEAFQYVGDELSRDENTVIKDKYAKFDFEAFMPVRGQGVSATPLLSEIPLSDWFQSSGMHVTTAAGYYTISNAVSSNSYLTIEIRRSSPDLAAANTQKVFQIANSRGSFDLDAVVGTKPKIKFMYQGNLDAMLQKQSIIPNFQSQKTDITPSLKSTTISLAELAVWAGSSFTGAITTTNLTTSAVTGIIQIGSTVTGTGVTSNTVIVSQTSGTTGGAGVYVVSISQTASSTPMAGSIVEPAVIGTSNVCFDKLAAPNMDGFNYTRYLTACIDGWSKGATPTDVTLTVLEDSALAIYNPDNNIEKYHTLTVRYSDSSLSPTVGSRVEIKTSKLQLAKLTNSKVANYTGQDLGFRNIGSTTIKFY